MANRIPKLIYWTPRILSILFICFLALFSLDVFDSASGFWQIAVGLLVHNIPTLILLAVLLIAWKHEIVGGIVFTAAGALYVASVLAAMLKGQLGWYGLFWIPQISGPAFLIGILFWVNWTRKRKAHDGAPDAHEQKVARIASQLKGRTSTRPVSLKKKAVSHEVPKPGDLRRLDDKLDISDLNEILCIDSEQRVCVAEPGVTFVDLVKATLKHRLVPIVVPELKTITVGGAVAGCSIESMSYKFGGFHDTCLEYEVITAKGDVLTCAPDNENSLVFQMMHGTFGTLGIISKLKFRLVPAKPFVKVTYEKYGDLESYKSAVLAHYEKKEVDFMDGIIHSPTELVLSVANFVDEAPYAHSYDWMRIYYLSTKSRKEDYLKTPDYFFRYDKGVTNVTPKSFLGRLILGKFVDSTAVLKFVEKFRRFIPASAIPVTLDTFIPFSKMTEFFGWFVREIGHFPLWCVPYRRVRPYEWINSEFLKKAPDELYLDIAIYGMRRSDGRNYYKMFEDELMEIGGLKTLITPNYYSETDFWKIWNKDNYDQVKRLTDPDNIFRDLYSKTCRATRGL